MSHPFAESNRAAAQRQLQLVAGYLADASAIVQQHSHEPSAPRMIGLLSAMEYLVTAARNALERADTIERMAVEDTIPMPPESGVKEATR